MRLLFLEHSCEHENEVAIYTDGSKSDDGVGFGVVFPEFERSGRLPNSASIFTAELFAILRAIKEVLLFGPNNFIIFSDSKSVLQSLKIFNPVHPLVREILEWLFLARRRGRNVNFCWVPAHVGITGNERADQLAKVAIANNEPRVCALPVRDLYPTIRSKIRTAWQNRWENLPGTNRKMLEITSSTFPWSYGSLPRRWETALCRLRIGHTRLTHGFLMADNHEPYCDDCIVPLTVKHILTECPSLIEERKQYLSYGKDESGNFVLSKILGRDGDFTLKGLFGFLNLTQFLNKF